MNKKLLFAAMSLAAFTACTDNNFESQKVAEETSPVEFEIINTNDAFTRASMGGTDNNTISWSAKDGDLFTLYYGAPVASVSGYDNATFKATVVSDKPAALTTPTMIKAGEAIMVWPVDTTFRITPAMDLTLTIPAEQKNTADEIPYVSDRITIAARGGEYNEDATKGPVTAWNQAGKDRKYPVYMRPMASQLNLKTDYAGTDAKIAELYTGDDPIEKIQVTSIDLLTKAGGASPFTTEIPVTFNEGVSAAWTTPHNAWSATTMLDVSSIAATGQTDKLTAKEKCLLPNNVGCKIILLPQKTIENGSHPGVDEGAVVVNTIYGKVVVAAPGIAGSEYTGTEIADAWVRYIKATTVAQPYENKATTAETSGDNKDKFKTTTNVAQGMMQTIDAFSAFKAPVGTPIIEGEPMGTAASRYVKVLLTHLDMSDLHIKSDKQLYDVVRVWDKLNLTPVTVYLDGDANDEFAISQKTIKKINEINALKGTTLTPLPFKVMPCKVTDEECATIVVTGGGDVQDVAFIADNGGTKADVAFNKDETWNWKGAVKVDENGVTRFINRGTMVNTEGATIKTTKNDGSKNNVPLRNTGTWNISGGKLFVQFSVTNLNAVNIAKGAEYRQDKSTFNNGASAIPTRFGGDDSKIGKVENKGVFATVNDGIINNVGLIEHADIDAKTYITTNQSTAVDFGTAFGTTNKMGTINLPYSNKEEDNISILAAADKGFVSVTVSAKDAPADGILNADVVGERVNYINITGGIKTIAKVSGQVKYVEINQPGTEIAWSLTAPATAAYEGLMVLSPVNIKLNTEIQVTKACYLGADMYVGGKFNNGTDGVLPKWNGYFGDTTDNFATMYVTY